MTDHDKPVLRAGALALVTAAFVAAGVPATAHAAPQDVAQAKARVEQLAMEATELDQQALAAQQRLDEAQRRLTTREADMKGQVERVEQMKAQVGQVALAQFQNRSVDTTAQIFLRADSEGFLSQYATVQQVTANQNGSLQDFQTQQANLADMKRGAESDVATMNKARQDIKVAQTDSQQKLHEAEAVLNKLTAEERARLLAEQQREAREAAEAAQPEPVSASGSSRTSTALAYAKAQVGKSYVLGATGPSSYDCSGLMLMAYKSAGVSLPRTSQEQSTAGRSVSMSDLQPGDLVFYGSLGHVAMYAGNGTVVHAANSRVGVVYGQLSGYSLARRVA